MSLSATYFQESAMATTGEWRDWSKLTHCSIVPIASAHVFTYTDYTNSTCTKLRAVVGLPW